MNENNVALISKCMKSLRDSVGVVDAEKFLFLIRSEAFDYTVTANPTQPSTKE